MLTRRHIRIKAMQSIYSISHNGNQSLDNQLNFFTDSVQKCFDLYYLLMSVFNKVFNLAIEKTVLEKKLNHKLNDSIGHLITNNPYFEFLSGNKIISNYIEIRKINNWNLDNKYINQFYMDLIEKEFFKNYPNNLKNDKDRSFCVNFFKECIACSDKLYEYLEDKQITWIDDFPVVNTHILKQLKSLDIDKIKKNFFPIHNLKSDEVLFGIDIISKVISERESLEEEIKGKTPNWESDRITDIDFILIKMAISEFLYFKEIPVRVTINEYIEIAKDYSTPKSNIFINGVLDNISKDFHDKGRLNKTGRGLL